MTYAEKLKLPPWQQRRLQILQRDGWQCRRCPEKVRQLDVHHKDYFEDKDPWEYPDCDLITLCNRCHKKEIPREKYENLLIISLRNAGLFADEILALSVFLDKYHGFRMELRSMINKAINEGL